tara:strand:+ start:1031 stop:1864 length:834 start_codon:yes stop_codon:yes gene_type:complete
MSNSDKFSLHNMDNYNSKLNSLNNEITNEFCKIINEYLFHINDNILIQNIQYYIFIIIRGLNMLKHIFNMLLLYTKNLKLTVHHCKKAYLFYVEFIGQIGNDNHSYLQLNSKDAMLFVYKKTIFEINNEYRKQYEINNSIEEILFKYINKFTALYVEIIEYVIDNDNMKSEKKLNYIMYVQKMSSKIVNKIILSNKNVSSKIEICDKYIYYKNLLQTKNIEIDECLFFNLSNFFIKKIQNISITEKRIYEKLYNDFSNNNLKNMSPLKFTNWLFNGK